ncbi:CaiB/BaiF CoA-transferase family protein [Hyphococcus flavus]|uniref:CaiB/BaiF CoA-transferase family protein n=1 Tax=Hyphococcus flavus TaxID=1866326 RepID=A0AAE9ZCX4_9PROT|nr:CaiB/BaiF CoA-transferase family protein [Hyphococcus flavus]WDI30152.1 CaiB/BaiF CoA-transferase family protein [Hyphococcus flavus]
MAQDRPLKGVRILEFAGIGPGPFCGMILSDLGADVVRIDRPGVKPQGVGKVTGRGRRSVALDLKSDTGIATALNLIEKADALFEGFRPGVMERIGLGPDETLVRNPALVYARMTGWGQNGPLSHAAGHDINYIALSGALGSMGRKDEPPPPPLNLVGDYGGGAMFLIVGLLAGLLRARETGKGQVIDAAMTDGSALLMALFHDLKNYGVWRDERGANLLDGAAPFYDTYECADGKFVSIGAIEPQFYALLLEKTGLAADPDFSMQMDQKRWPELKHKLAAIIRKKTRDEWVEIMEGTDVCFAPVLSLSEAPTHPHNVTRNTFIDFEGTIQPAAAPRFRGVPNTPERRAPEPGEHTEEVLAEWDCK